MRLFRSRGFVHLWLAGLLSLLGDWALVVALPFYVYQRTGSVVATGAMFAAETLPPLLLGSAAGVLVDRWDRRRAMVAADLGQAALLLLLLATPAEAQLHLIYPVAFLAATAGLLVGPAEAALLPALVGEEELVAANAVTTQADAVARIVAPPLGGALVAAFGLDGALLVDAASFLASAALIGTIAAPVAPAVAPDADAEPARSWPTLWREWREGLSVVARSRVLLVLFATGAVANVTEGMSAPLFVPFVEEVLHGGAPEIGLWFATNGLGVLAGGAAVVRLSGRLPLARLLGLGYAGVGLCCAARNVAPALLPALVPGLPPASAIVFNPLVGALAAAVFAAHPTLLQRAAPDAYRGRVFGALGTTDAAAMLAGAALATALGDALGPLPFYHALAAAYLVAGAVVLAALPADAGRNRVEDAEPLGAG